MFLKKKTFKIRCFSLFCKNLPLDKGVVYFNKFDSTQPNWLCAKFVLELDQRFWRKKWKCEKFTPDNQTDDWRQAIGKAHLSSRSGDLRTSELEFLTKKLFSNSYFPLVKKGKNAWKICPISTKIHRKTFNW